MLNTTESDSSIAPVKYFILKVVSLKYLYIFFLFIFLIVAFLTNKFARKIYESSASISPVENKTSSVLSSNQPFGGSLASIESLTDIENEMNNLNSFALVYKTIKSMNFEISYFQEKPKFFKQTT